MQKKLPLINSAHGSETRNIINELIKLFNGMGYTYDEALQKAHDVLEEAKQTNDMNKDVQQQINTLIAESGTSDAEVLQARTDVNGITHPVLNERLNNSEDKLENSERVINVRHHGAKGDGVTDDWQAIQSAISSAETTGRSVYIPSGTYFVSRTLRTQHQVSYNYRIGIRIYGNGKDSVIMGERNMQAADYSDITKLSEQALLAIHGANNIVEKLAFEGGKIGLYLGQDPDVTAGSSASMNIIRDLWFYYNGTGVMLQHGDGTHYNKFYNMHIAHAQIGIHLQKGWLIDRTNNNRNTFENIRVARAWIGYLVEDGDGNFFNKVYSETIQSAQAIGEVPNQLPLELENTPCAIVVTGGQYNTFDNYAHESCDWDIYSTGFRTSFMNGMIKDDAAETYRVMFPLANRQPLNYLANSAKIGDVNYQIAPDTLFKGIGGTGFRRAVFDLHTNGSYHKQTIDLRDLSSQITTRTGTSRSRFHRVGGVCHWLTNYRFTVSNDMDANEPLRIFIPFHDSMKLDIGYTEDLADNQTFPMEVAVGSSNPLDDKVWARFSTASEASAYGGEHLIVPAPSEGWNLDTNTNYLFFRLTYDAK